MKYLLSILSFIVLSVAVNAQQVVVNDANAQARTASGFHAINVSGGIDIYLSQGSSEGVAVSASESKYRDKIKTEVRDGVLVIFYEKENGWWGDGVSNKKLKAYVTVKNLDKIHASGASDIYVSGVLKLNELKLQMSGASDFKGAVECNKLSIDNSGASDVNMTGTAKESDISLSGASDFKDYNFATDYAEVKVSGASDVKITVNKEISARASGASDIYIKGNGVIRNMNSSGASSIKKRS
jgi:hypothetical protein